MNFSFMYEFNISQKSDASFSESPLYHNALIKI
jgi:hypothetical protein